MYILFWGFGIIGNLFGEKFVWGMAILGIVLAAITLGGAATISVVLCAPGILRAGYNFLMKR
ncbi:hypothetical protein [Clostridium saudiense]|uniref:hypothetical protein n=1 Tax=Clostridium saudiense TaxID=1414720 RepID=UPI0018AA7E40|nr:hypothetical protein [Clostridium saudiense]